MKHLFLNLCIIFFTASLNAQYLVSYEFISNTSASDLTFPGVSTEYDVDYYKIIYNTEDVHGDPSIASGAFAVPVTDGCQGFPIGIYMHGTTLSKENVPSRENSESELVKIFASSGFYAVAPDYIGMGDSPGLHPYVHAESEATAGRDLIRAAREMIINLNEEGSTDVAYNEVFITGYSQGGHAAMALHKHLEDNDLLDEFNVVASAPASGPYNMSGSQVEPIISDEPYSNPGYMVYLLASYELAYGNIYETYDEVLNAPYDGVVVPYFDGNNTTLSMGQLNPQLPEQMSELITPDFLNDFVSNPSHPLWIALEDNDNYDWATEVPVKIYYCTADEQVNYQNSIDAIESMTAAGSTNVEGVNGGPFNHSFCVLPSMTGALNWFTSLKTDCEVIIGIEELAFEAGLSPNPVDDFLSVNLTDEIDRISIYSVDGRQVQSISWNFRNTGLIDLKDLESATYIISFYRNEKLLGSETLVVK